MSKTKLSYGMVGGDLGAFIGGVHRKAIAIEETAVLKAGCFSSNPEKNLACGTFYALEDDRIYDNYQEMADQEARRTDKIDFVVVVTPNRTHYDICKAFLEKGFHVVCEKPLCFTTEQARELRRICREKKLLFCVTYTYTGYNMIKLAKDLVAQGELGEIINIHAEYLQEWLIDDIGSTESATSKLSVWRKNPEIAGASNCVGDIGSHIEALVTYVTGLKVRKLASVLDYYGQPLDLNANMLVEMDNGCHGVFCASQVCAGHANGLVLRIYGTEGALKWFQEDPNYLYVTKKGRPEQRYDRGTGYISGRAAELNRVPSGHPEGIMIAFANIYHSFINALLKLENGEELTNTDLDFPDIDFGVRGVEFITLAVESSKQNAAWIELG